MHQRKTISKPSKIIQINTLANIKKNVSINFNEINEDLSTKNDILSKYCEKTDVKVAANSSSRVLNQTNEQKINDESFLNNNEDKEYDFTKFIMGSKHSDHVIEKNNSKLYREFDMNKEEPEIIYDFSIEEYNGLSSEFILNNLDYDKRIKTHEKIDSMIFIDFWSLKGSLSFYRQYFNFIDMSFAENWEKERYISKKEPGSIINTIPWREIGFGYELYELRPQKITINLEKVFKQNVSNSKNQEIIREHEFFEDLEIRIKYFSKYAKHFTASDIKNMQICVEAGDFEFIYRNPKILSVGSNTNVIVQEAIKLMDQEELYKILTLIEYDLGPISATKYGAYVVQILIDSIKETKVEEKLKSLIIPYTCDLLKHPIGNYAIQKILRLDPKFVLDRFIERYYDIVSDDLGLKVLKKCIDDFKPYHRILFLKNTEIASKNPKLYKEIGEFLLE